jgi:hypothetical protein
VRGSGGNWRVSAGAGKGARRRAARWQSDRELRRSTRFWHATVDQHGEDALGIQVADLGQDPVPSTLGIAHVALGLSRGIFQTPVLDAEVLDRVLAEIGNDAVDRSAAGG